MIYDIFNNRNAFKKIWYLTLLYLPFFIISLSVFLLRMQYLFIDGTLHFPHKFAFLFAIGSTSHDGNSVEARYVCMPLVYCPLRKLRTPFSSSQEFVRFARSANQTHSLPKIFSPFQQKYEFHAKPRTRSIVIAITITGYALPASIPRFSSEFRFGLVDKKVEGNRVCFFVVHVNAVTRMTPRRCKD